MALSRMRKRFLLRVETEFSAAHSVELGGEREGKHGHNFHVWAEFEEHTDGWLTVDLRLLKRALEEAVAPLDHTDLNEFFAGENPTSERVAHWVYWQLREKGFNVVRVGVSEKRCYTVMYSGETS